LNIVPNIFNNALFVEAKIGLIPVVHYCVYQRVDGLGAIATHADADLIVPVIAVTFVARLRCAFDQNNNNQTYFRFYRRMLRQIVSRMTYSPVNLFIYSAAVTFVKFLWTSWSTFSSVNNHDIRITEQAIV